jgi:hypothetical protein
VPRLEALGLAALLLLLAWLALEAGAALLAGLAPGI